MRVLRLTGFVILASACGPRKPPPSPTRELPPSHAGAERFEVTCEKRSECDRRASEVCPNGHQVVAEWQDDGSDKHRARLEPDPAGSIDAEDDPWSWFGEVKKMGMVVECWASENGSPQRLSAGPLENPDQ